MLIAQHSQNSSLSFSVRLLTLIYSRAMTGAHPHDSEVFAKDKAYIRLQLSEYDTASRPVALLIIILHKLAIIEVRAE